MDQPHLLVDVCKRLTDLTDSEEAYVFAFRIYDELVYRLTLNPHQRPYYLSLSFLLIRLEYLLKDYKQERIRHRHLLCDPGSFEWFEQQLVYWTILLEKERLTRNYSKIAAVVYSLYSLCKIFTKTKD